MDGYRRTTEILHAEEAASGYRGRAVVQGFTLDVRGGELISVVGPNGAGKSTILKMISSELRLTAGRIAIAGEELDRIPGEKLARREAVLLTERIRPELMSVREVVEMGRYPYTGYFGRLGEDDREAVEEALSAMSLEELAERDYRELSDGQKQRVLIARALAQSAELLILDEPTSYLDIRYRLELAGLLSRLVREQGIAVIATFHELELALKVSHRVVCVKNGRIHSLGTPGELLAAGALADLFDLDAGDPDTHALCPWIGGQSGPYSPEKCGQSVPYSPEKRGKPAGSSFLTENAASTGKTDAIVMLAFTRTGRDTMRRLAEGIGREFPGREIVTAVRTRSLPEETISCTAEEFTGEWFPRSGAMIFVGAAGIAVRCIAPFVRDKFRDPAVLCVDEAGKFCISLLSGHVGGGNELCIRAASILGARPVITTASDGRGAFSPDRFAAEHGLAVRDREAAKRMAARILEGDILKVYAEDWVIPADSEIRGSLAGRRELTETGRREEADILLTVHSKKEDLPEALYLVPRCVHIGTGCRRGTPASEIGDAVAHVFEELELLPESAADCASIDLKEEENGLKEYCAARGLPLFFFSAEELEAVPGEFPESDFVKSVAGVGNVCGRSAAALALRVRGSGGGAFRLPEPKAVYGNVTVGIAVGPAFEGDFL